MGWTRWICINTGSSNSYAYGDILPRTLNGLRTVPIQLLSRLGSLYMLGIQSHPGTFLYIGCRIRPRWAASSSTAWLCLISTRRCSWICCIVAWTWSAFRRRWYCSLVGSPRNDIWESIPWTAKNGVHLVVFDIPLFATNSARGIHCTQLSCWWLTNTRRYCSILAFIRSVWPFVWGWNAVDICQSIPRRLHIWPQKVEVNWGPQFERIVAGSRWRRTTSRKNNLAIPIALIIVWRGIKCRIFESLSTTTQITSNPSHSGNPTTKSTEISSHGSSGTDSGRRTPNVKCWELLDRWQLCQFHTYWSTCPRISFQ